MSDTAPYYMQAFSPLPRRCFRLVSGGEGGPTHCPEPAVWQSPFRIPNGHRHRVEAWVGHRPHWSRAAAPNPADCRAFGAIHGP